MDPELKILNRRYNANRPRNISNHVIIQNYYKHIKLYIIYKHNETLETSRRLKNHDDI